jgi:hypothetical protein
MSNSVTSTYPLLGQILLILGLPLQPMYTTRDLAQIFKVSVRAIQHRIEDGRLVPRDLPGRARFLPQDLEDFLTTSRAQSSEPRRTESLDRRMASR